MGDATQDLVDEARRQARILIRTGHGVEGRTLYERLADALEAAQRPPISPEVRKEMFRLLYDASGSQLMRPNERHSMVTEQRDALLARFSVPSRPPINPEQRETLERAGIKALVESAEVPTGVRGLLLGEVFTIREAVDAEPVVRVILDAILPRLSAPSLDEKEVAS